MVFSGYMPSSGIAGSYGNCIFSFLRNTILFYIVAAPIYIPTNSVRGFPFPLRGFKLVVIGVLGVLPWRKYRKRVAGEQD